MVSIVFATVVFSPRIANGSDSVAEISPGSPTTLTASFLRANRLYDDGNFSGAIDVYQFLIAQGVHDSRVYYNLASAYYRDKKLGLAILNLLRAKRLSPRDGDIQANLTFLQKLTVEKLPEFNEPGAWLWRPVTLNELTGLFVIFYFLGAGAFIAFRLRLPLTFIWRTSFGVLLFLAVASGFLAYQKYRTEYKTARGIIIAPTTEIKSGPGNEYVTQLTGHEGFGLVVISRESNVENPGQSGTDSQTEWLEALFANGLKGWVRKETVELL